MNFLGEVALMLFMLVGYSSGAVIAGRGRKRMPGLLDLGIIVLLLAAALATRSIFGKWVALPIGLVTSGLISALLTTVRYGDITTTREARQTLAKKGPLHLLWDGWKAFSVDIGNYQGRVLFAFFYFLVVTPFGIGVRIFRGPSWTKQSGEKTSWVERSSTCQRSKETWEQF